MPEDTYHITEKGRDVGDIFPTLQRFQEGKIDLIIAGSEIYEILHRRILDRLKACS